MSSNTRTSSSNPEPWHPEFIKAQQKRVRIIFIQGLEAVFLRLHADLVRTVVQHAPPEHAKNLAEMVRPVDLVEASEVVKRVIEVYDQEALAWPEHTHSAERMLQSAPPDLVKTFKQEAQACGLLPSVVTGHLVPLLY